MWYSKQLRQVRRARQAARAQQHQLLEMELEGIVAITLHAVTQSLTVATERAAGAQSSRPSARPCVTGDRPLKPKPASCARTGRKAKRSAPERLPAASRSRRHCPWRHRTRIRFCS